MTAFVLFSCLAIAAEWEPDTWAPVSGVEATPVIHKTHHGGAFEWAYRQYRKVSRPTTGSCPFYPTCSGYFIIAVRERGPILAGIYTIDRLVREHPWLTNVDHYPIVMPHETLRLSDPIPSRRRKRDRR